MIKRVITYCFLATAALWAVVVQADEAHHGPHHISLFLGNTDIEDEGSGETVGIDYEYRVNQFWGLGTVVEYAFGDLDAWTVLAVADLHLTNEWIVQVGPGVEYTSEHDDLFVARIGTLYEFVVGNWTFSPQLHYDYHDGSESAYVVGFAVGFAF